MIVTADTNLFVYAVDLRDAKKHEAAGLLISRLADIGAPIGLQVVGEFYHAIVRRLAFAPWQAAQAARNLLVAHASFKPNRQSTERALAEAAAGRFSYWDAALLSAAEQAGCTHILSEDMHDGARLGRLEIVNPFGPGGTSDRACALLSL